MLNERWPITRQGYSLKLKLVLNGVNARDQEGVVVRRLCQDRLLAILEPCHRVPLPVVVKVVVKYSA